MRPASLGASAFPLTEAERRGDFSSSTVPVRDPANANQPFPGNQIPTSRFDPVAQNLLNPSQMPLPNRPDGQLVLTFPSPQNNAQYLLRADWNLGRHVIDGRYNLNRAYDRASSGDVPSYLPIDREANVNSITIGDTWSVTPTLLNQARISFNRISSVYNNLNQTHLSDLGGNFPLLGGRRIPPTIGITGRVTLGNASSVDATAVNESLQVNESMTWNLQRHTLKGGYELTRRNSMTSPYLWMLCMSSVVPAVLWWDSTPVLGAFILLFAVVYLKLYWRIVRFRAPRFLAFRQSPGPSRPGRG